MSSAASDNNQAGISQLRSLRGGGADLSPVQSTEAKHCWVCFANEDDDYSAQWVSPCKCRGTAKWVHKSCLQRWIDEKQQGNSTVEVACPQCNSTYLIVYPKCGLFVRILDFLDRIICKACPFLAGGILVGSVYWTAVTYGAVTIMQVLGHKEGLNVMEKADPLIMLIGLPAIPMMLMLGRLVRWEDAVLKFWRKHSTKLPLINLIFPNNENQYLPRTPAAAYTSNSDPISFTRTVCGGLILPTIATIFGKILFQRINSNFQRSIIGGISFVGLKGIFKIYYKQQQYLRQAHRQIKNFDQQQQQQQSNRMPVYPNNNNSNNLASNDLVNRRGMVREQAAVAPAASNYLLNDTAVTNLNHGAHVSSFVSQDGGNVVEYSSPAQLNSHSESFFSADQSTTTLEPTASGGGNPSPSSSSQQQRYQLIRASSEQDDFASSSSSSSSSSSTSPSSSSLQQRSS